MATVALPDAEQRSAAAIDVVVPVYNAPDDLVRCVDSVLVHTVAPYRLVLIDDASPDPAIAAYFTELAQRALPHVALLRNERNVGFTATANRAMRESGSDVVLLNSDAIVTSGWLDALARCADSDPSIGTITPFSNNAEICSFPRLCENNPWPEGADPEPVRAALARAAVPTYPDLPTGVGFCLYVRRTLIDAIGTFDPAFGLGYGEENDFCLRAASAGWRNVLCDDAFVLHVGGQSFEGQKAFLGARNLALIQERYPRYTEWVRDYIDADPLRPLRGAALAELRAATGAARGVLHVIHGHGGGTEHHARALIDASREQYRHYLVIAVADSWQVEEHLDDSAVRAFAFRRGEDEAWPDFVGGICATFRIDLLHLHNISGCRDGIAAALVALGLPYGYTVHDLSFACPTILFLGADGNYCYQETDPAVCGACLRAQPAFAHIDIADWRARHRALIARAQFLIAPSRWAAAALERYYPEHAVEIIPHAAPGVWALRSANGAMPTALENAQSPLALPDDGVPTIAILGAVGPDKGARRLERLVTLVRAANMRLRFVLIGYMDVEHGPWQSADRVLTIHGRYNPRELPDLLLHYRVRLVAFPSAGPETFSFTLSEAWAAGVPVVVPPFGALSERVAGTGAGWIGSETEWRDETIMLAHIAEILAPENAAALAAAGECARAIPQHTPLAMAERTLQIYNAAAVTRPSASPPLAPSRVRDALGYAPWVPPVVDAPAAMAAVASIDAPPMGLGARIVRTALGLRHTLPGRILFKLAPQRLRNAFRTRPR